MVQIRYYTGGSSPPTETERLSRTVIPFHAKVVDYVRDLEGGRLLPKECMEFAAVVQGRLINC